MPIALKLPAPPPQSVCYHSSLGVATEARSTGNTRLSSRVILILVVRFIGITLWSVGFLRIITMGTLIVVLVSDKAGSGSPLYTL